MTVRVLRFKQLRERIPYSRMHIFRLERDGRFPQHIQLGANSVAWLESEIDEWIAARAAARSSQQIEPQELKVDMEAVNRQVEALKAAWSDAGPEARREFLLASGAIQPNSSVSS